jgi:aryl-alcohol dehydrogenase-like predicted oxidoreductase
MALIPRTELDVSGLCLGGNVFGWTADREASFAVLDGFIAGGGNFIDTADVYTARAPGNSGGESETIIGEWLAARDGMRDAVVIATKMGKLAGLDNLRAETIRTAAENSLKRLGVDHIDLYYAHFDDPDTRLTEALETADREGLPRYVALQPHYNLMERDYEADQQPICAREDIACFPFYALAKGFLTGKYRPGGETVDSVRAEGASAYLDERGERMLAALDEIAAAHEVEPAAVAVAWLREQDTVLSPIASARTVEQLRPLIASIELSLAEDELGRLTAI